MAVNEHHFAVTATWTGNQGTGTSGYRDYGRGVTVSADGVAKLEVSAARAFHGSADRWNPELLLVAALSECHLLSYLHVATNHGVTVTAYTDEATGTMQLNQDSSGHFTSVTLRPVVTITDAKHIELARQLHDEAAQKCFIANSVNFLIHHEPRIEVAH